MKTVKVAAAVIIHGDKIFATQRGYGEFKDGWEFPGGKGWVAVRYGKWKGLLREVKSGNDRIELFDISTDLREEHDLAAEHPEIVEKMRQFIRESHTEPENPLFMMDIPFK